METFGLWKSIQAWDHQRAARRAKLLVALVVLCLVMALSGTRVSAQETLVAPAEPTATPVVITDDSTQVDTAGGDVEISGDGGTLVQTDTPDVLQPLIAFGGVVFALMEIIKNGFLTGWVRGILYREGMTLDEVAVADRKAAFMNWVIASVLALVILVITESSLDVLLIFGYQPAVSPFAVAARTVCTAMAAAAPNALLHAAYDALRKRT